MEEAHVMIYGVRRNDGASSLEPDHAGWRKTVPSEMDLLDVVATFGDVSVWP